MTEHQHTNKSILDKEAAISTNEAFKMPIYTEDDNFLIDEIMDTSYIMLVLVGCPQWGEISPHKDEVNIHLSIVFSTL